MKKCHNCHGNVSKVVKSLKIAGITIDDILFEECDQCHERYFDEQTAIFIQQVQSFVRDKRKSLILKQE